VQFPDSLPIPDEVHRIAEKLEHAGFETWCVGGAIRDNLLGHEGKDVDLATAATPKQMQKVFRRTIPVGIEHGTLAILDRNNKPHEVTTFRKDVRTDGRHAEVEFGVSLDEDLARRDFTINAIAYHPLKKEWRDLFGGTEDMDARVIRAVGDPDQRFKEDYLRILRALRFAARFGFEIEPTTWTAANSNVAGLQHLSAERVREEWFGGLKGCKAVAEFVTLWRAVGALKMWLPEVDGRTGGQADRRTDGQADGAIGTGLMLDGIDHVGMRDPVLITSFLSDDPGKTLSRLKCSKAEIERGTQIGRHRGRWPNPASEVEVRRWMAEVGDAVNDLAWLARVEGVAEGLEGAVELVRESGAPLKVGDLAVTGDDLLAAGVQKGPRVGEKLQKLLDLVLEDPTLNTKEKLLARVKG
jgi:tRNA nucleotidyltransferase (CCA-adding enzyme)